MIRASAVVALLLLSIRPAFAELRVATDMPIVQGLVAEVLGDTPPVIIPQGADPHSYQMRPSEARALAEADVVIWLGEAMTPWMERVLDQSDAVRVTLLDVAGTHLLSYDDSHDHGAHDDEDAHAEHGHDDHADDAHDHDDHGHDEHADGETAHDDHGHDDDAHGDAAHDDHHDHGDIDPHAWLDPDNARVWLAAIGATLGAADPANADTYTANADAAAARIGAMKDEIAARLAQAKSQPIVVFHDAYGYLEEAFDLNVAGSIAIGDAAAPGARRIAELRDTIAHEGVTCIFREPQHSPKIAEQVAAETGTRLGTLDPLGALMDPGPEFYARVMSALADSLVGCSDGKS